MGQSLAESDKQSLWVSSAICQNTNVLWMLIALPVNVIMATFTRLCGMRMQIVSTVVRTKNHDCAKNMYLHRNIHCIRSGCMSIRRRCQIHQNTMQVQNRIFSSACDKHVCLRNADLLAQRISLYHNSSKNSRLLCPKFYCPKRSPSSLEKLRSVLSSSAIIHLPSTRISPLLASRVSYGGCSEASRFFSSSSSGSDSADDAAASAGGDDQGGDGGDDETMPPAGFGMETTLPALLTVPEVWPKVPVIAVRRHPVFPRFTKIIEVKVNFRFQEC